MVVRFLGKEEVESSILSLGSAVTPLGRPKTPSDRFVLSAACHRWVPSFFADRESAYGWHLRTKGATCDNSSVGRASPCHGEGRGFESLLSLQGITPSCQAKRVVEICVNIGSNV